MGLACHGAWVLESVQPFHPVSPASAGVGEPAVGAQQRRGDGLWGVPRAEEGSGAQWLLQLLEVRVGGVRAVRLESFLWAKPAGGDSFPFVGAQSREVPALAAGDEDEIIKMPGPLVLLVIPCGQQACRVRCFPPV